MNRLERFYRIDQMLHERGLVTRRAIMDELEISLATFKRDLDYMRDRFHAPVIWDRDAGGYRFDTKSQTGPKYELPGLWLTEREAFALATMQHLLTTLDPAGLVGPQIAPLRARLDAMLGAGAASAAEIERRIRIVPIGSRRPTFEHFSVVGAALLERKRLAITYHARSTDADSEREVSPQRLVHYRDNWYLDAWCHLRKELRTFAVDGIRKATVLDAPAREISAKALDDYVTAGYGIFAGDKVTWAKLRFSKARARWVGSEDWHPQQRSSVDGKGRYVLEVPYANDSELVLDILRHGAEVEVLAPAALREKVRAEHAKAAELYR